jgi:hypothetical protein
VSIPTDVLALFLGVTGSVVPVSRVLGRLPSLRAASVQGSSVRVSDVRAVSYPSVRCGLWASLYWSGKQSRMLRGRTGA